MVGPLWIADIALASINAALLLGILIIHVKSWKYVRGGVLLGASAFVFLLMAANVSAAYFAYDLAKSFGTQVATPILYMQILQVIGYAIFFVISWKY